MLQTDEVKTVLQQAKDSIGDALNVARNSDNTEAIEKLTNAQKILAKAEENKTTDENRQITTADAALKSAKSDITSAIAACGKDVPPALLRAEQEISRLSVTSIGDVAQVEGKAAEVKQVVGDQEMVTLLSTVVGGAAAMAGFGALAGMKEAVSGLQSLVKSDNLLIQNLGGDALGEKIQAAFTQGLKSLGISEGR